MKKCNKCNLVKPLMSFGNDKYQKDLHKCVCKECAKIYRNLNKDKALLYRESNKVSRKEYDIVYKERNKEKINNNKSIYYQKNKESLKNKSREYYQNNRDKKNTYQKEYQQNNKDNRNKYLLNRRENNPLFRLITNIRNLIGNSFRELGYSKKSKTCNILGCSFVDLKIHLELKFEDWMTWENRGLYNGKLNYGWDIDHIIPLSSAMCEVELLNLNHHKNLQPLCSKINREIKRNLE